MKEPRKREQGSISLWGAISIGVGGMVGAGIFSILGVAADIAGNAVYLSFLIAGFIALLNTYSYAKLGTRYPSAGGPVEFLVQGFGDNVLSGGFNILLWFGYVLALSLYAKAFGGYIFTFFPAGASHVWVNIMAITIIALFTAINFIGAKAVGQSETLIVSIKVGILMLFALTGIFFVKPSLLSVSLWPDSSFIFFGAAMVFIAYEGFGLITNAAEDMKNPRKTLPRALYLSVIIVMLIYLTVSLTVVGNLPLPQIHKASEYALAEAAKPFLGLIGFKIIAIAALFSTASAINATLYGGANVSFIAARNGQLPKIFERKVWGRSVEGLFITAGLVVLFVLLFDLSGIAMIGSASFLMIYAAVNVAHLFLYRHTLAKRWMIWLAILGDLMALLVILYYNFKHNKATIFALLSVVGGAFLAEVTYRKAASRKMKTRLKK